MSKFTIKDGQSIEEVANNAIKAGKQPDFGPRGSATKTFIVVDKQYLEIPEELQATEESLDIDALQALIVTKMTYSKNRWFLNRPVSTRASLLAIKKK
jgi:hypothetical protein